MQNNFHYVLSGTYTWPSGNVYDGEWKDNHRTGRGSAVITHLFLQRKHPMLMKYLFLAGTYRWTDGDVYEGEYLDGKQHGQGKRTKRGSYLVFTSERWFTSVSRTKVMSRLHMKSSPHPPNRSDAPSPAFSAKKSISRFNAQSRSIESGMS